MPRFVPWTYVGRFLLPWHIVHSALNEAVAESCPDHGSHVSPACLGVQVPDQQFRRCPTSRKNRTQRNTLVTLLLIRRSYRKRTTRFIFSAGAPFTRRDRTCGSGHFGVWMHSCTSRIKPASSHFCRKLRVSRVRAPRFGNVSHTSSPSWWLRSRPMLFRLSGQFPNHSVCALIYALFSLAVAAFVKIR